MVNLPRMLRHLALPAWSLRRAFDAATLQAIEQAIAAAERSHGGEIRFAVEASVSPLDLMRGITPRHQALEAFARLGVWDTEANNGVLIYVLLADRDVEIVADRGFNPKVDSDRWSAICDDMEQYFRAARFQEGAVAGVKAVGKHIALHYPRSPGSPDRDELPNRPALL
jgi:uncharacterized membrane protein